MACHLCRAGLHCTGAGRGLPVTLAHPKLSHPLDPPPPTPTPPPPLPSRNSPETMYGQTNCWALPDGDYAAYRGLDGEVYVMTARAALNLSYQARRCAALRCAAPRCDCAAAGPLVEPTAVLAVALGSSRPASHNPLPAPALPQDRTPVTGQPEKLLDLKGTDLLGLPVKVRKCLCGELCALRRQGGSTGCVDPCLMAAHPPAAPPATVAAHAARPRVRAAAADHPDQQGHGHRDERAVRRA